MEIMMFQEEGHVHMEYNLGTESIIISDQTRKFNNGVYHTVRYNTQGRTDSSPGPTNIIEKTIFTVCNSIQKRGSILCIFVVYFQKEFAVSFFSIFKILFAAVLLRNVRYFIINSIMLLYPAQQACSVWDSCFFFSFLYLITVC